MASYIDPDEFDRLDTMSRELAGIDLAVPDPSVPEGAGSYLANRYAGEQPAPPSSIPAGGTQVAGYGTNIQVAEGTYGNPNAKNPNSSAKGRFQIIDPTFDALIAKFPHLKGKDRNDPAVLAALADDDARILHKGLGRRPTNTEVHAAHVFGASGGLRFIQGTEADPTQPAYNLASPAAVKANPDMFFDKKTGRPRTAMEVRASAERQFGTDTYVGIGDMPGDSGRFLAARFGGNENNLGSGTQVADASGRIGVGSDGGAGGGAGSGGPSGAGRRSNFPSAEEQFGDQKRMLQEYKDSQPEMWKKLEAMQSDYKNATAQSPWDTLKTGMNQYQQQSNAARANQLATAGGIITKSMPSPDDFNKSLENTYKMDRDTRAEELARAKTSYDLGSGNLLEQNRQAGTNVNAQVALANDKSRYTMDATKVDLEDANRRAQLSLGERELLHRQQDASEKNRLAQDELTRRDTNDKEKNRLTEQEMKLRYGDEDSKALQAEIHKVANLKTQAIIQDRFLKEVPAGTPRAEALKKLAEIKLEVSQNPDTPLENPKSNMMLHTYYVEGREEPVEEPIDLGTPAGLKRAAELRSDQTVTGIKVSDMSAPKTTINTGTGATETGGVPAGAYQNQSEIAQLGTLAKSLLPHLKSGTGLLNTETARDVINAWNAATGRNDLDGDAREMFHTVVDRMTQRLLEPRMAALKGAMSDSDLRYLQSANAKKTAPDAVLETFLDHTVRLAEWEKARQTHMLMLGKKAERSGAGFGPNTRTIAENAWIDANPLPTIDLKGMVDEIKKGEGKNTGTIPGFIEWGRRQLQTTPNPTPGSTPRISSPTNMPGGTM